LLSSWFGSYFDILALNYSATDESLIVLQKLSSYLLVLESDTNRNKIKEQIILESVFVIMIYWLEWIQPQMTHL